MKKKLEDWLTKKLTTPDLERFLRQHKTDARALVVNCKDSPYQIYFKNRYRVNHKDESGVDEVVDYYHMPFEDESYEVILCTGLLEHLAEPEDALKEMKRILKPGGKILLGASSAFSVHDAPHDYFHFTPYGLEYLLEKQNWKHVEVRGSCGTMKTMGILLQRIAFQSKSILPFRILMFLTAKILPAFQFFIREEYGDIRHEVPVDHLLSSNVHGVAIK